MSSYANGLKIIRRQMCQRVKIAAKAEPLRVFAAFNAASLGIALLYSSDAASVPCAKCNVCCGQISNGLAELMQMLLETQHNSRHDNGCLMGIDVDSVIYLSVKENRME